MKTRSSITTRRSIRTSISLCSFNEKAVWMITIDHGSSSCCIIMYVRSSMGPGPWSIPCILTRTHNHYILTYVHYLPLKWGRSFTAGAQPCRAVARVPGDVAPQGTIRFTFTRCNPLTLGCGPCQQYGDKRIDLNYISQTQQLENSWTKWKF